MGLSWRLWISRRGWGYRGLGYGLAAGATRRWRDRQRGYYGGYGGYYGRSLYSYAAVPYGYGGGYGYGYGGGSYCPPYGGYAGAITAGEIRRPPLFTSS